MNKRITSYLLVLLMLLFFIAVSATAADNPFNDVTEESWYYDYVLRAYELELFQGITDSSFAPDDNMTRAMFVTVLYRMEKEPECHSQNVPFADVGKNIWYSDAVIWGYENEIIKGTSETTFSPDDFVSREQLVTLLFRYSVKKGLFQADGHWDNVQEQLLGKMEDSVLISEYAKEAIAWAYTNKIIQGRSETVLAPQENTTRAEAAKILCVYLDVVEDIDLPKEETTEDPTEVSGTDPTEEPTEESEEETTQEPTEPTEESEEETTQEPTEPVEELSVSLNELPGVDNYDAVASIYADASSNPEYLSYVSYCSNLKSIHLMGMKQITSEFLNSIRSNYEVSVVIQLGQADFSDVNNGHIGSLYLVKTDTVNLRDIIGFSELNLLYIAHISGYEDIDFSAMQELKELSIIGHQIADYERFTAPLKQLTHLSLRSSNLRNEDTVYLTSLSNLEELDLWNTFVNDISFLSSMPKIQKIVLPLDADNLDVLMELPNLKEVYYDALTEAAVSQDTKSYFEANSIHYPVCTADVGKNLSQIIDSFAFTEETTSADKIKAITAYVLDAMSMDTNVTYNGTALDHALSYGTGSAAEYAILEYALLRNAGIEAYYVEGYALFFDETGQLNSDGKLSHCWNLVHVDSAWYAVDPFWMDDDMNDPNSVDSYGWRYFYMVDPETDMDPSSYYLQFASQHVSHNQPQDTVE